MIVVDTSALMEVVLDAPSAGLCSAVLEESAETSISAGTLAEALAVAGRRGVGIEVVPVTSATARRVSELRFRRDLLDGDRTR